MFFTSVMSEHDMFVPVVWTESNRKLTQQQTPRRSNTPLLMHVTFTTRNRPLHRPPELFGLAR